MKNQVNKEQILRLANSLAGSIDQLDARDRSSGGLDVSGVYVNNEIGFPLRMFTEECNDNPGEPKNYDDAYDKACKTLSVESCESYEEHGFVWFSPE